jgi:hypothetical protein
LNLRPGLFNFNFHLERAAKLLSKDEARRNRGEYREAS